MDDNIFESLEIPMEYDSPLSIIQTSLDEAFMKVAEAFDDQVVLEVRKQCGIDIDKEKLEKVLTQDRDRYQEAYKKGYTKGYLDRQNELVRCKDCKHYNIFGCSEGFGWCERYNIGHTDDWFCADGEREENNDHD